MNKFNFGLANQSVFKLSTPNTLSFGKGFTKWLRPGMCSVPFKPQTSLFNLEQRSFSGVGFRYPLRLNECIPLLIRNITTASEACDIRALINSLAKFDISNQRNTKDRLKNAPIEFSNALKVMTGPLKRYLDKNPGKSLNDLPEEYAMKVAYAAFKILLNRAFFPTEIVDLAYGALFQLEHDKNTNKKVKEYAEELFHALQIITHGRS